MRYLAIHEHAPRGTFAFPIELYQVDASHPRYEMPFHWHMESELIIVREGSLSLSVDGTNLSARAGDCFFVSSGAIHGGIPQSCTYECAVFDLDKFLTDSQICARQFSVLLQNGAQIQPLFLAATPAARIIHSLFDALKNKQPGCEFLTTGLILQWIGIVLQNQLYAAPADSLSRDSRRAEQMKNVLRRIRRDYAVSLSLEDLAAEADMTPQYFCRAFRQLVGRTPIDYLNYYRIEYAAELLCTTTDNVTEIALSCGFNDLSYFTRQFRRHKGMSAIAWRKQHRPS